MDAQPPPGAPQPPPLEPQPPQLTLQPQPPSPPSASTPERRRAVSRRQVLVALVAMVAIVAGATVAVVLINHHNTAGPVATRATKPSTPQPQPPLTVPQVILQRNTNSAGTVDFQGALELFSYVFTPLPGVTVPTGAADNPGKYADLAITLITANLNELTGAQRQAVLPFITDVAAPGTPGAATPARSISSLVGPVLTAVHTLASPGSFVRTDIAALIATAIAAEGAKLGHGLADSPALSSLSHVALFLSDQDIVTSDGSTAPAWTVCSHGPAYDASGNLLSTYTTVGKITDCYIFAGPSMWNSKDGSGHWVSSTESVAEIYHEVFHCFQAFVIGSVSGTVSTAAPAWVIEGGADWAAASILPYDEPAWEKYLQTPGTPLSTRSYDAFGLFFEIEYQGRPLWPQWWGIWQAAAAGGWGTSDWYNAIVGDHLTALANAWGASYYQDASLGHDWTVTGTGQLLSPPPRAKPGLFGGDMTVESPPYATAQVVIPEQSPGTIVVSSALDATFRVIDESSDEKVGVDFLAMCWGSCTACPSSSDEPPPFQVDGQVDWAFTSEEAYSQADLQSVDRSTYCKQKKTHWQPKPRQTCLANCAGSNGDPHLRTVNAHSYNLQATGEYTLLRSPDGTVEIQARHEPWSGSPTDVTVNTAVAARVGTHRVGVYAPGGAQVLIVRLDGKSVPLTSPMNLSGGGRLVRSAGGVEIDLPDGTMLWALFTEERYGINIEVIPSAALSQHGVGLLGPIALSYSMPKLPDGTGMHISANAVAQYDFEYQRLAPAWRVTGATSLFDYDAGKSTASYTVPGFLPDGGPPMHVPIPPSALDASETTCGAIADVDLRDDCVYDVAETGDQGFATSYAKTASFFTGTTSAPPAGGQASPTPTASSAYLHEILANAQQRGYVIGPDGSFDIQVVSSNQISVIAVDPATSAIRTRVSLGAPLSITVPDGLASSSGSLWLIVTTALEKCAVDQLNAATLAVQNTMPLPACPMSSPGIAGTNDEVWADDGKGHLVRIDMAHKDFSATIALPANAQTTPALLASSTAVFWSNEIGVYRVDADTSSLVQISDPADLALPVGQGIWRDLDSGTVGFYDADPNSPTATLDVPRDLIGADANNVYTEDPTTHGILKYPTDGSAGVALGTSTSPSGDTSLIIGEHNAFRIFGAAPQPGSPPALYIENFPLP
jgi:hypothetical protein